MTDAAKPIRLAELAGRLGRDVVGDGDFVIGGVASLEGAGPRDLSFVRSSRYQAALTRTAAGALIVPDDVDPGGRPAIRSPNPDLDFARAVEQLVARPRPPEGLAATATVAPGAQVDPSASVGPAAVVGVRCRVGARSVLHPGVILYPDVVIGEDCVLHGGVVLREGTELGNRVVLQPGVVLGGDGFGYLHPEGEGPQKVPQVGRVVVEDDVEIGANSTVDRATLGETRIRRGAKIDNLVQIAHNCDIGENVVIVAQSGLSGSTRVGRGALLMAQVGSAGHLRIGDGAFVGARAGLHKDVAPGARVFGSPQLEGRAWHRSMAALARLPEWVARLRAVERVLRGSSKGGDSSGGEES